jgi:hypothetical protein
MKNQVLEEAGDDGSDLDWSNGIARCAALVRQLERDIDVNSLKFRGFRIWPRIRTLLLFSYAFGFAGRVSFKRYKTLTTLSGLSSLDQSRITQGLESAKELDRIAKINAGRPLAFLGTTRRQARSGETLVDLLFDPLIDLVPDLRIAKLAIGKAEGDPAATKGKSAAVVFDPDLVLAALAQFEPAHEVFLAPDQNPRSIVNFEVLRRALPDEIAADFTETMLVKDATAIHRASIVFRIYLERAEPPFVLLSGQKRVNLAMTLAARQLGIPTVDIQHGAAALSPNNIKWHSWTSIPDEGYELLPDYFWVWGHQAAKLIDQSRNPRCGLHRPLVGGHPTLMSALPSSLSEDYRNRAAAAEKVILITLGHIKHGGLPPALIEAMSTAPGGWRWLLRAHPLDWASAEARKMVNSHLRSAGVQNCEITETSSAFLHHVLEHVDWHVTPYSSCAVEAASFGVPTIYIDPLASTLYDYLLEQPGYYFATRADEIVRIVKTDSVAPAPFVEKSPDRARAILHDLASPRSPSAARLS